jgi:hypothetical protein
MKVWCVEGQRPLAPVQHRYEWRYLVGFVYPTSGRTVFHLATSVSIPSSKPNSLRSPTPSALQHTSRLCSCWIAPAGTPVCACACLTMSTCSSSRPIRPNSSPPNISGLSPTRHSSTVISTASRNSKTRNSLTAPRCKPNRISFVPPHCSIGGPLRSTNVEARDGINMPLGRVRERDWYAARLLRSGLIAAKSARRNCRAPAWWR